MLLKSLLQLQKAVVVNADNKSSLIRENEVAIINKSPSHIKPINI